MMKPLVSIGMAVWNCEETISPALQSILLQTYQNWELLLIDDGSSDHTLTIARSFQDSRIRIIVDGIHQNLPARLNQAIALGQGKYFALGNRSTPFTWLNGNKFGQIVMKGVTNAKRK